MIDDILKAREKASKTGEEFSLQGGERLMEIYNFLSLKTLLVGVCKVMLLNELELMAFMTYLK